MVCEVSSGQRPYDDGQDEYGTHDAHPLAPLGRWEDIAHYGVGVGEYAAGAQALDAPEQYELDHVLSATG